jgi:hypothetical protein
MCGDGITHGLGRGGRGDGYGGEEPLVTAADAHCDERFEHGFFGSLNLIFNAVDIKGYLSRPALGRRLRK